LAKKEKTVKFFLKRSFLCVVFSTSLQAVVFQGLIETGITKNSFMCPLSAAGSQDCSNVDAGAIGFKLTGSQILQFFNNQSYWLRQEVQQKQNLQTNQRYSASDLQAKMASEGWVAMGGYCILISVGHILNDVVMPTVQASGDNVKVVVQLWYNGDQLIQLWSQDAVVLKKDQGFQVLVTSDTDTQVAQLPALTAETTFLGQLGLQQNNRQPEYMQAAGCPRMVKIQAMA
jgi:hypothetical protein